ncbi:amidohydrolase family protein [Mesorhizobium sp.]|uniref:amidohydrolase family protein n=2 Tax=Mesorhizobium TaxID=68287 RepID=UPI0025BD1B50|nr:amidohydrolase family protein [Mesorhizobium sp.]
MVVDPTLSSSLATKPTAEQPSLIVRMRAIVSVTCGVARGRGCEECPDFPLPQIRSALGDITRRTMCASAGVRRESKSGMKRRPFESNGNFIKATTANPVREAGAFVVPTNITFAVVARDGARYGMSAESLEKVSFVLDAGLSALETLQSAGVTMGYGSDLLGQMHGHQSEEFLLRGRVLKPRDVIRSATVDAARVLNMEGLIGTIAPGAHADLIAVYGNPLKDLAILSDPARLRKIIKGG